MEHQAKYCDTELKVFHVNNLYARLFVSIDVASEATWRPRTSPGDSNLKDRWSSPPRAPITATESNDSWLLCLADFVLSHPNIAAVIVYGAIRLRRGKAAADAATAVNPSRSIE